ncbi:hypothetical protein BKA70DRAFT_1470879 [Coprinopsis sp. MPI-PUGE-AT-0042]|nr:hypothetical protein BKA70DRAFT_1470879 [Coprinopsis sp. MPI-PUGE-AT-0042]
MHREVVWLTVKSIAMAVNRRWHKKMTKTLKWCTRRTLEKNDVMMGGVKDCEYGKSLLETGNTNGEEQDRKTTKPRQRETAKEYKPAACNVISSDLSDLEGESQRRPKKEAGSVGRRGFRHSSMAVVEEKVSTKVALSLWQLIGKSETTTASTKDMTMARGASGQASHRRLQKTAIGMTFAAWLFGSMPGGQIQAAVGVTGASARDPGMLLIDGEPMELLKYLDQDGGGEVYKYEQMKETSRQPSSNLLVMLHGVFAKRKKREKIIEDAGVAYGERRNAPWAVGGNNSVPYDDGKSHPRRLEVLVGAEKHNMLANPRSGFSSTSRSAFELGYYPSHFFPNLLFVVCGPSPWGRRCPLRGRDFVKPSPVGLVDHVHYPREVLEEGASPLDWEFIRVLVGKEEGGAIWFDAFR